MDPNITNTLLNATNETNTKNVTFVATTQGFLTAYSSLFIMAVIPIFIGSMRSVIANQLNKETGEVETMTSKDAAMFPFIASGALLGIYLFFKIFSKEYINMLLTGYFLLLGVLALTHMLRDVYHRFIPKKFPNASYLLTLVQHKTVVEKAENDTSASGDGDAVEPETLPVVSFTFDHVDALNLACSIIVGGWYLYKKHWIANNIFGLSFSVNAIEFLHLNKVITGVILLCGLFIYDIFWVFGTNVMVDVAKNFEAPIKLVFPQDLLEKGFFEADKFAMLGLGDIVIPGIFIALLLRFDASRGGSSKLYFYSGMVAYALGLLTTIWVMHFFKHAQPALLYLVPACVGCPILLSLVRGEVGALFKYQDTPDKPKEE